ncbi:MAG: TIM barrel protein [Anaerolineales bacterium]|nr:TIM barrel protein [Anaerolineales bacterium]
MLKLAIQTNVWSDEDHRQNLPGIVAAIAAAGYAGLEIGAHRLDLDHPQDFLALLHQHGLQVAGIHTHGQLYDPQAMTEAYPRIRRAVAYAAAVQSPFVLISGGPKPGKTPADQAHEAQTLNQVGQWCTESGLSLCYHNHYWEIEHNQAELHALCEHTDPRLVSLALDIGWVHRAGGAPAAVASTFLDRIRYFHFKDFRIKDFQHDTWAEVGTGYVDFQGVLEVIRGRDYWLTVERDEALAEAAESARTSYQNLHQMLINLGL